VESGDLANLPPFQKSGKAVAANSRKSHKEDAFSTPGAVSSGQYYRPRQCQEKKWLDPGLIRYVKYAFKNTKRRGTVQSDIFALEQASELIGNWLTLAFLSRFAHIDRTPAAPFSRLFKGAMFASDCQTVEPN
jgi:hypothetical protein